MKLASVDDHLKEQLKDPQFRECYERDKAKIDIAKKIIGYRIKHSLSQAELAKKIKISQKQISLIEEGESYNPASANKILRALSDNP